MPLSPVNFVYLGDCYRFFVDLSAAPEIHLNHTIKFEGGSTHYDVVEWEEVPFVLKEMLIEKVSSLPK